MSSAVDGLGAAASRGAATTMLGQGGRIAIQLVGVVLLSRTLDPSDFGLVAMVVAVVGVGEVFRDFGLTQAAVQAPHLSQQQRSNLFWLNSLIGTLLSLFGFFMSWPIAVFFGEPRLVQLAQAISVTFILNGLGTQYRAHLARNMRFGALAGVEVGSQAAGLAAGLIVAFLGGGYWALAVQQIVAAGSATIPLLILTKWIPGLFRRGAGTMSFVKFGGYLVTAQLITYVSKNIDSVIIGSRLGASDLGYYNRAFQVLVMPLNQINAPSTRVALPVLARLVDDRPRFDRFLLTGQTLLVHGVALIFALAAAVAEPLLGILLGPGWGPAVPIFQILAISGVFQAAAYATYWVFLANAATRSQLLWALSSRPVIIVAVLIGSIWGVSGVAWAYSISNAIVWPLGLLWVARACGAPSKAMFFNGTRAVIGYSFASVASLVIGSQFTTTWSQLAAGTGAFILSLAFISLIWRQFRKDLLSLPVFVGKALRRRGSTR
ncbi:lipopolysaccharide biosynthesis protein [Marisediminicola senii]|uniref:lipopolysaccharide biosynthesis protein n=1 Tax=Marisediminicola senii TaxID=2711233 RepID=UPI0013EAE968|nr:lipopolysaccharide biosynthesis protein [Marisediminicola senii]